MGKKVVDPTCEESTGGSSPVESRLLGKKANCAVDEIGSGSLQKSSEPSNQNLQRHKEPVSLFDAADEKIEAENREMSVKVNEVVVIDLPPSPELPNAEKEIDKTESHRERRSEGVPDETGSVDKEQVVGSEEPPLPEPTKESLQILIFPPPWKPPDPNSYVDGNESLVKLTPPLEPPNASSQPLTTNTNVFLAIVVGGEKNLDKVRANLVIGVNSFLNINIMSQVQVNIILWRNEFINWAINDLVRVKETIGEKYERISLSDVGMLYDLMCQAPIDDVGVIVNLMGLAQCYVNTWIQEKGGTVSKIPKLVCLGLMSQAQLPNKEDKVWSTTPVFEYKKQRFTFTFQGRLIRDLMMKYNMQLPEFIYKPVTQVSSWNFVFIDGCIVKLQCVENGKVWNILENSNDIIVCVVGDRTTMFTICGDLMNLKLGGALSVRDFWTLGQFCNGLMMLLQSPIDTYCNCDSLIGVRKLVEGLKVITIVSRNSLIFNFVGGGVWGKPSATPTNLRIGLEIFSITAMKVAGILLYRLLNFVYDRGKFWEILFEVRNHKLNVITLSLQIYKLWLLFGLMGQAQIHHQHHNCIWKIKNDLWSPNIIVQLVSNYRLIPIRFYNRLMTLSNAMRSVVEVYLRMILICHGLLNFVFDRGKL
jgi:hypothetical protein